MYSDVHPEIYSDMCLIVAFNKNIINVTIHATVITKSIVAKYFIINETII